jgi:outer membrane protein OmpA-like peptidoglycan-associated protein
MILAQRKNNAVIICALAFLIGGCATMSSVASRRSPVAGNPKLRLAFSEVIFRFDSARLTERARAQLDANLPWLRLHPASKILFIGETDRIGPAEYNRALGDRRARSVAAYLLTHTMPVSQFAGVVSLGESRAGPGRQFRRVRLEIW